MTYSLEWRDLEYDIADMWTMDDGSKRLEFMSHLDPRRATSMDEFIRDGTATEVLIDPTKVNEPPSACVQSSEFILVKTDKLTRKALMEPLPANDGTQPLPTQTYECTCATNPGVLQVRRLPSRPKDRQAHV